MPAPLKFSRTHEWVRLEGTTATVGISDFAVKELTDLVYMQLPRVGAEVTAGESFGEVESVKAVSDLYAPVSGTVTAVNDQLPDNLHWLAEDPYGRGWVAKIQVSDAAPLDELLDEAAYREFCKSAGH